MTSLATAFVTIKPDTKGFGTRLSRDVDRASSRAGTTAGKKMGGGFKSSLGRMAGGAGIALGAAAGTAAVLGFTKKAIGLEAEFSKTMNQLQATTGLPKKGMQELSDLALKMGADTVFSASDASKAMLELAKNGITPATIQAGALSAALTLAAAGGVSMESAATTMGNALNAFELPGTKAASVAAALAGAANASSASVDSLAQGLQQAATGAHSAGLSVQETAGALAAFANAGIDGSDAGTSLKTFLTRLVPQTDKASFAMESLGLMTYEASLQSKVFAQDGIKPLGKGYDGAIKSVEAWLVKTGEVNEAGAKAKKMARDYLEGTGILNNAFLDQKNNFEDVGTIAGALKKALKGKSDAERTSAMSTIFGSDATRAANVLAKEGTEGLAKYVKATSDKGAAEKMAAAGMKGTAGALESLKGSLETVTLKFGLLIGPAVTSGLNLLTGLTNKLAGVFDGFGGGSGNGGIAKTVEAIVGFGKALVPTIKQIAQNIGGVLGPGIKSIGALLNKEFLPAFRDILPIITPIAKFLLKMFGEALVGVIKGAIQVIKGIIKVISGVMNFVADLIHGRWGELWGDFKQIISGVLDIIVGMFKVWWNMGILSIFKKGVVALLGSFKGLGSGLKSLAGKAFSGLTRLFSWALKGVARLFVGAIKGYVGLWVGLFKGMRTILSRGFGAIVKGFKSAFKEVKFQVQYAGLFIAEKAAAMAEKLLGVFAKLPGKMGAPFRSALKKVKEFRAGVNAEMDAMKDETVKISLTTIKSAATNNAKRLGETGGGGPIPRSAMRGAMGGMGIIPKVSGSLSGVRSAAKATAQTRHDIAMQAAEGIQKKLVAANKKAIARANAGSLGKMGPAGRILPRGSYRIGMPYHGYAGHNGADYPASTGTPVYAPWAGRVTASYDLPGSNQYNSTPYRSYGRVVKIAYANGMSSLFAHLSSRIQRLGPIAAGTMVGRVGMNGNATGPHLHAEFNGGRTNPASLGLFDRGGILRSGGAAVNLSGRTERVLDPRQTRAFEKAMASVPSGSGGGPAVINIYDVDGRLMGTMRGEAMDAARGLQAQANTMRRQGGGR